MNLIHGSVIKRDKRLFIATVLEDKKSTNMTKTVSFKKKKLNHAVLKYYKDHIQCIFPHSNSTVARTSRMDARETE